MDHPSLLAAQSQQSAFRSSAVSPNVRMAGMRHRLAQFNNKPVKTGMGFSAFAVRQQPYADGQRISGVEPQALQQLLTAYLIHHGTHS